MEKIIVPNILDLFPADEGSIDQIYGIIGSGKTYIATCQILEDLKRGQVVYANWKLNFEGYDERKDFFSLILGSLGFKRFYKNFPKENFHYLEIGEDFNEQLGKLTDCIIYLDEGHIVFDSYQLTRMPIEKRANVLHTRHFNRTIKIISQRPTAIHVTLRANVNRFFKCENLFKLGRIVLFKISEFQDLTGDETVDETKEYSSNIYFGKKKIFEMYNTKYLRGDMPVSQENKSEVYFLGWKERLSLTFSLFWGSLKSIFKKRKNEK